MFIIFHYSPPFLLLKISESFFIFLLRVWRIRDLSTFVACLHASEFILSSHLSTLPNRLIELVLHKSLLVFQHALRQSSYDSIRSLLVTSPQSFYWYSHQLLIPFYVSCISWFITFTVHKVVALKPLQPPPFVNLFLTQHWKKFCEIDLVFLKHPVFF